MKSSKRIFNSPTTEVPVCQFFSQDYDEIELNSKPWMKRLKILNFEDEVFRGD